MFGWLRFFITVLLFLFVFPQGAHAQSPQPDELYKAEVTQIVSSGDIVTQDELVLPYQIVKVKILEGKEKGKEITIDHGKASSIRESQKVKVGEKVVLLKLPAPEGNKYQIIDKYRLDALWPLIALFFILILILSRWKGLGSIAGLIVSIIVITQFIVPQILAGHDALLISIIGSAFIMITTIYLAHGFSRKTHIAIVATFLALVLTGFLAHLFVGIMQLSGLGSDDAFSLQFGPTAIINFKGLLLGGIIIGSLGVLDDITTSLSATVEELKKANPKFSFQELVKSGLRVGSEHISSLVNTLVLAYAGVSFYDP